MRLTGRTPSRLFPLLVFIAAIAAAPSLQSQTPRHAQPAGQAQTGVPAQTANHPATQAANPYLNTRLGTAYVGSKVCAACHQEIYYQFKRTGMGQSMSLPSDPSQLAPVPNTMTNLLKKGYPTRDYELLADLLSHSGKAAEAIGFLQAGIRLAPYTPSFYSSLADIYLAQGAKNDAAKALSRGLDLFPEDARMRASLEKLNARDKP